MQIAIYALTSSLHNEQQVDALTREFLSQLTMEYTFMGGDFSTYGTHDLDLIYVRTGGSEALFRRFLDAHREKVTAPIRLLTSGKSNSLAASMEILSFLRQQGMAGEIIHGSALYMNHRIELLARAGGARKKLKGQRLGIIGEPSDWLISSHADKAQVKARLGIELVPIAMTELLDKISKVTICVSNDLEEKAPSDQIRKALPGAEAIYEALKTLIDKYQLNGFTLRCFDLLTAIENTGCLALARFNAEGIVACCEGDVPAMLSMALSQALTGCTGFQANPARIDVETGEMLFAHCTIPLNMVEDYELDTHFESGIGVGIRGYAPLGPVTIFKLSGDANRFFAEEGTLLQNTAEPNLCRTQQIIRLDNPESARYFLTNPIGNHHIILPGRWKEFIAELVNLDD